MNEQTDRQLNTDDRPTKDPAGNRPDGFGDAPRFTVDKEAGKKNEAVLGPFTVRDLTVFGSTFLLFVASLIPMFAGGYNLWNLGSLFFLGLGIVLPLVVSTLFTARRVTPETRIRFGSLSMDQFASVVASFSLAFFFLSVAGAFVPSMLVGLVGALGLFAATVLGRWIPFFAGDFMGRTEIPAHVVARETAVPVRKPRALKPPKEAKESGTGTVAGWAHRIMPGSRGATPQKETPGAPGKDAAAPATRNNPEKPAASSAPAASAAASAAAAGAGQTSSSGSPETRVSGVVPPASSGSSRPTTQSAEASGTGPKEPSKSPEPSAAEKTQVAGAPAAGGSAPTTVNPQVRAAGPIGATVDPASRPSGDTDGPAHEAFWFAVAQPRTAVDEQTGAPAFDIEPGGWVLALEDRGQEFLVQNTDGRLGVLRDLSNIERG
ncbi:MAG: hypothetical protein ABIO34_03680 [Arthrobacter oryzae]